MTKMKNALELDDFTGSGRKKMKMYRIDPDCDFAKWRDWHVLTIAKASGSALEIYAWGVYGVDTETIKKFADRINEKYETDSLYPKAPVSALPFRYFHFVEEDDFFRYYADDFRKHFQQFLEINRTKVKARKILVDLHRDSDPVWDCFLTATEKAVNEFVADDEIDEVALMK
jgi:hypothetical protein